MTSKSTLGTQFFKNGNMGKALLLIGVLGVLPLPVIAQIDPLTANPGFENAGTFSNWVRTGAGTLSQVGNQRSGARAAGISGLGAAFTTLHNLSFGLTVPSSGTNYVTVVAWARSITGSGTVTVGVDAATSADPDGPTAPGGTLANVGNGYTRVTYTFLATNGQTYHPVLYARQNGRTNVRWDDVYIYTSTNASADIANPAAPNTFTVSVIGSNIQFNFNQGADAGANQSGINGVLILRSTASPMVNGNVTALSQSYYSTNPLVGPTSVSGFSVRYNGPPIGTFTESFGGLDQAVYLVYMRDNAFNYTTNNVAGRVFIINSPTSGYTVSNQTSNTSLDALFVKSDNTFQISTASTATMRSLSASAIAGTVRVLGNLNTQGVASRLVFQNGSTLHWQNSSATIAIPIATWQPGSTLWVNNTTNANTPSGGTQQNFSNFRWEMPLQTGTFNLATTFNARGNVEVVNCGTGSLGLPAGGNHAFGGQLTISDDLTVSPTNNITFNSNAATQTISGSGNINPGFGTITVATSGSGSVQLARSIAVQTNFTINAGAQFNGGVGGHALTLTGTANFTNNGIFTAGNGKVIFNSASPNRTIGGSSTTTFNRLLVNNVAVPGLANRFVVQNADIIVNDLLVLTDGGIRTNNRTLTLSANALVTGLETANTVADELAFANSNQSSFIALCDASGNPNTSGGLRRQGIGIGGRIGAVAFPVGFSNPVDATTTQFSPVVISQAGAAETYTIRSIAPDSPPGTFSASSVDYTYNIFEETPGGSNCTVRLYWQEYMEGAVFDRSFCSVVHSDGSAVDYFSPAPTPASPGASVDYFFKEGTGFMVFSPFCVTSNPTLLPLRSVQVSAFLQRGVPLLSWMVEDDEQVQEYVIERSRNGGFVFEKVGKVNAEKRRGRSAYSFADAGAGMGDLQYRIVAYKASGQKLISQVVVVSGKLQKSALTVSPNPIHAGGPLQMVLSLDQATDVEGKLIGADGRVYKQFVVQHPGGQVVHSLMLPALLGPGTYVLILSSRGETYNHRVLVQ